MSPDPGRARKLVPAERAHEAGGNAFRSGDELELIKEFWTSGLAGEICRPLFSAFEILQGLEGRLMSGAEGLGKDDLLEVRKVLGSIRNVLRVSRDLEQFSRLDARNLELNRRQFDLRTLVKEVIRDLSPGAQGRPVRLIECGPLKPLSADRLRIAQVLTNLLSNAIDFGDPGSPIRLEVDYGEDDVRVSVVNAGKGISKEALPHVFEARRARGREGGKKGLGLGLYVTRGLIEAHGGHIWAESEPGRETAFRFILPLRPSSGLSQAPEGGFP